MANKITKAMNDATARANAVEALNLNTLAKVSNTEYALTVKNEEGVDTVVVVKLTVPKVQLSIEEMVGNYEADAAEKEAKKAEKAAERAAKKAEKETKKEKEEKTADEEEILF